MHVSVRLPLDYCPLIFARTQGIRGRATVSAFLQDCTCQKTDILPLSVSLS